MEDTENNVVVIRDNNNGRFVKGQSGNPSGGNRLKRLKAAASKMEVTELLQTEALEMVGVLGSIARDGKNSGASRVSAAKFLVEMVMGKAVMTQRVGREDAVEDNIDTSNLSPEMMRQFLEAVRNA